MFERILICLDGSNLAEQILPLAQAQAGQFASQIVLLQVVTKPAYSIVEAGAAYLDARHQEENEQSNLAKARAYLDIVALQFREKGILTETAVVEGESVGKAILGFAEENRIDLIAIATHGHGGLGRVVFGSVAEYVLKESGLPMLLIRPKQPR
jgi:nucleotide-binding universal stress UspA family protein